MNSPIKWLGSKRSLVDIILPLIPKHKVYVEPFFGGGSVFFAKNPSEIEIINDVNDLLVTFFAVLRDHPDEFMAKFDFTLQSRTIFDGYRKTDWTSIKNDPIETAFRFYYLIRNAYCGLYRRNSKGVFNAPFCGAYNSLKEYGMRKLCGQFFELSWILPAHERLKLATIENKDYRKILTELDGENTFFFMDPPYDTDYAYGVKNFDYDELVSIIRDLKGSWILTLNEELADKFSEFPTFRAKVSENIAHEQRGGYRYDIIVRSKNIQRMISARL